ncbi:Dodecenoyl-CoA delta-isomerase [Carabus blaptoides fortunei]
MAFNDGVTISIENGIHIIKFNNPKQKNALNLNVYQSIAKSLEDAAKNPNVLVTVFTGEGEYYTSGNAIPKSLDRPEEILNESLEAVRAFVAALIDYPKLLVAVVNGPAIGIGVTTLGLCDIVYASSKATFQTPFSKLALCAEACSSYTFPRILGKSKACEVLYVNHKMTAEEAEKYGLVSKVYEHSELHTVWNKIAEFTDLSLESILISKQMSKKFDIAKLHEANNMEIENLKIFKEH